MRGAPSIAAATACTAVVSLTRPTRTWTTVRGLRFRTARRRGTWRATKKTNMGRTSTTDSCLRAPRETNGGVAGCEEANEAAAAAPAAMPTTAAAMGIAAEAAAASAAALLGIRIATARRTRRVPCPIASRSSTTRPREAPGAGYKGRSSGGRHHCPPWPCAARAARSVATATFCRELEADARSGQVDAMAVATANGSARRIAPGRRRPAGALRCRGCLAAAGANTHRWHT